MLCGSHPLCGQGWAGAPGPAILNLGAVRSDPDGPRSIHRQIGPGSSFGNNPFAPTIGLGRADAIAAVEVAWPCGGRQVIRGVPLDRAIEITEGRQGYRRYDHARRPTPVASH